MTVLRRPRLLQEGLKSSGVKVKGMGSQVSGLISVSEGENLRLEWLHPVGEHLAAWLVSQLVFKKLVLKKNKKLVFKSMGPSLRNMDC